MTPEPAYEFSCPECGATDDIDIRQYDFGMCQETGYRDAGEMGYCACGFAGEVDGNFKRRVKARTLEFQEPQGLLSNFFGWFIRLYWRWKLRDLEYIRHVAHHDYEEW